MVYKICAAYKNDTNDVWIWILQSVNRNENIWYLDTKLRLDGPLLANRLKRSLENLWLKKKFRMTPKSSGYTVG